MHVDREAYIECRRRILDFFLLLFLVFFLHSNWKNKRLILYSEHDGWMLRWIQTNKHTHEHTGTQTLQHRPIVDLRFNLLFVSFLFWGMDFLLFKWCLRQTPTDFCIVSFSAVFVLNLVFFCLGSKQKKNIEFEKRENRRECVWKCVHFLCFFFFLFSLLIFCWSEKGKHFQLFLFLQKQELTAQQLQCFFVLGLK